MNPTHYLNFVHQKVAAGDTMVSFTPLIPLIDPR